MAEAQEQAQTAEVATQEQVDDFQRLLSGAARVSTVTGQQRVQKAVATLAEFALRETAVISDNVIETINAVIAEIDRKLSDQLNLILHHEKFQQLEGSWRGLKYLVSNTETDRMLKIRVMNVSKKELAKELRKYKGSSWDQSPLFRKIYSEEYGQLGGAPYGALIGDYYFDHTPQDVELLGQIAQIAAAAHAPFIAGAAPSLMGMESWQELSNPRDIANLFEAQDYAAWRALRDSDDARYLGLTLPRFLARLPYGAKTEPVEEFDFEEDTGTGDHKRYTWANAAYAMAVNINRSFKEYGWCTAIRGAENGGTVYGLPLHTFPSTEGGVDVKCPTEIAIDDRRDFELSNAGLMALVHRKNSNEAVFMGAQSLQKPKQFSGTGAEDANANAKLSARLPYVFAASRFAHYLKCMVRDKIGSFMERADLERYLSDWIKDFVLTDPSSGGDELRAKMPLAGAEVHVEEVEGSPGEYRARFALRPHYQLEGVDVSLSLVSRLPSQRKS